MQIEREYHCEYKKMFESRFSAGAKEKLFGSEKSDANTIAWSCDMEGHATKCVERCCGLANKKVEQQYKVSAPSLHDHEFEKKEGEETVGEWSSLLKSL